MPKDGDNILFDMGNGEIAGSVMWIGDGEIEITTDGGDTSFNVWLEDLTSIVIL